jgi:23S rRNA pseudouridine1911/1915/1917 synthase
MGSCLSLRFVEEWVVDRNSCSRFLTPDSRFPSSSWVRSRRSRPLAPLTFCLGIDTMSSAEQQLAVDPGEAGQRLDSFLAERLSVARSQVQRWIEAGRVELSPGRPAKASLRLKAGWGVLVRVPAPEPLSLEPEALPVPILFQDEHLAVVDKPRGMPVHPSAGHSRGTLVHALLYHLDRLSGVGGMLRPGIVHRLDRTTSGLLVVAKTDRAHQSLAEQFRTRTAGRIYFALAWGALGGRLVVDQPVGRHPTDRKRMAVVPGGRRARTVLEPGRRLGPLTEVEARLDTGRTHQIRVHLAFVGHPVAGDRVYGPARPRGAGPELLEALEALGGCALHARELHLVHPASGEPLSFHCPLPSDLARLVERLERGELE